MSISEAAFKGLMDKHTDCVIEMQRLRKAIEDAPCPGYNTAKGPVYWCGEGADNCGCWKREFLK